jgi:hypothetical protein
MTVNDAPALAWGPLPSAAEVEAHVTRSSPARASDGAPWARRDADGVSIVYVRAADGLIETRDGSAMRWLPADAFDVAAQWRPVDGDGMPVER